MLTQEALRQLLTYDPATGHFTRRVTRGRAVAGSRAGFAQTQGYIQIGVNRSFYLAHRLAWLYMTGDWPVAEIDHRDGDKANNKWVNLRSATRTENCANARKRRSYKGVACSSPFKGVSFCKSTGRWQSHICKHGRMFYLGMFDTQEEAHATYVRAATEMHGAYARTS